MAREFWLGRGWRAVWWLNVLVASLLALGCFVGPYAWWRVMLAIALVICASWSAFLYRRTTRAPLVSITEDGIVDRPMMRKEGTLVPRAQVRGVHWSNPGAVCFRMRSGELRSVTLLGLSRRDRIAIVEATREWGAGA